MQNSFRKFSVMLLCAIAAPAVAAADDAGLYDAPPSPDSSFVRILNPAVSGGPEAVVVDGKEITATAASLSPYLEVASGDVTIEGGDAVKKVSIEPGAYATVVVREGAVQVLFKDAVLVNPAKSRLYFYNMSDAEKVTLFVPAAKVDAIKEVGAGQGMSVELKAPLQLDFVAQAGGRDLARFPGVSLQRRGGQSLILFGSGGNYTGAVVKNSLESAGAE